VLTDMAMSLRGMGFTTIVLMGDSGGNQGPMKDVAAALDEKYRDSGVRFHFIPEYYDYASARTFIKSNGIDEQIEIGASQGSDRIHEEYSIDAIMALHDPATIRIEQRTKANRTTINGVSLLPMNTTLEMGRPIVELRATLAVTAIRKAMAKE
jgi:creatinine amidohydrolase